MRPDTWAATCCWKLSGSIRRSPTTTKWRERLSGVIDGRSMAPGSWPGGMLTEVIENRALREVSPVPPSLFDLRVDATKIWTVRAWAA